MRFVRKFTTVALLSGVLAACTNNPLSYVQVNCPAVAIVSNTGSYTNFTSEERNVDDVAYKATISRINSSCVQEETVRFDVTFEVTVEKGPQFEGDSVTLPYFVTLLRDNYLITAKKNYETTINLPEGYTIGQTTEHVIQIFEDVDIARRYDYELLIGFQLEPEDVAYNALY